jgi:hypothetical protein
MRLLIRATVVMALLLAIRAPAFAEVSVGVSVSVGPPAMPVYDQPPCPADGYVWTPGYWAWDPPTAGYYWVPGTWVVAPAGMLWTPGYWGWRGGFYVWHHGYWGHHIGFYGGINYGYGYPGSGYYGGSWRGGVFYYNRAVTNVSVVHVKVYNQTVIQRASTSSYNGGPGGVPARATPKEEAASRAPHLAALPAQEQHQKTAGQNPQLYARANRGVPPIAATARPAELSGHAVVAARAPGPAFRGEPAPAHRAPMREEYAHHSMGGSHHHGGGGGGGGGGHHRR